MSIAITIIINTVRMINEFKNADDAFCYYYDLIKYTGQNFDDTKALFNVGFTIENPEDNFIKTPFREWKQSYADAEWQWYLSGDRNIKKLGEIYGKVPPIWERMADEDGNVNSNYGWQWKRELQLNHIIKTLIFEPNTRQAAISIYDGKERSEYDHDTPCTYAVQFTVVDNRLNMSVVMRSNDLWYGFCNDQYCFSKLQELVAKEINMDIGSYYHFAHNLHIYNDKLNLL